MLLTYDFIKSNWTILSGGYYEFAHKYYFRIAVCSSGDLFDLPIDLDPAQYRNGRKGKLGREMSKLECLKGLRRLAGKTSGSPTTGRAYGLVAERASG